METEQNWEKLFIANERCRHDVKKVMKFLYLHLLDASGLICFQRCEAQLAHMLSTLKTSTVDEMFATTLLLHLARSFDMSKLKTLDAVSVSTFMEWTECCVSSGHLESSLKLNLISLVLIYRGCFFVNVTMLRSLCKVLADCLQSIPNCTALETKELIRASAKLYACAIELDNDRRAIDQYECSRLFSEILRHWAAFETSPSELVKVIRRHAANIETGVLHDSGGLCLHFLNLISKSKSVHDAYLSGFETCFHNSSAADWNEVHQAVCTAIQRCSITTVMSIQRVELLIGCLHVIVSQRNILPPLGMTLTLEALRFVVSSSKAAMKQQKEFQNAEVRTSFSDLRRSCIDVANDAVQQCSEWMSIAANQDLFVTVCVEHFNSSSMLAVGYKTLVSAAADEASSWRFEKRVLSLIAPAIRNLPSYSPTAGIDILKAVSVLANSRCKSLADEATCSSLVRAFGVTPRSNCFDWFEALAEASTAVLNLISSSNLVCANSIAENIATNAVQLIANFYACNLRPKQATFNGSNDVLQCSFENGDEFACVLQLLLALLRDCLRMISTSNSISGLGNLREHVERSVQRMLLFDDDINLLALEVEVLVQLARLEIQSCRSVAEIVAVIAQLNESNEPSLKSSVFVLCRDTLMDLVGIYCPESDKSMLNEVTFSTGNDLLQAIAVYLS